MNWSAFFQTVIFIFLGAYVYSCGKAGASLMLPFAQAVRNITDGIRRQPKEPESITPNVRS